MSEGIKMNLPTLNKCACNGGQNCTLMLTSLCGNDYLLPVNTWCSQHLQHYRWQGLSGASIDGTDWHPTWHFRKTAFKHFHSLTIMQETGNVFPGTWLLQKATFTCCWSVILFSDLCPQFWCWILRCFCDEAFQTDGLMKGLFLWWII